MPKRILLGVNIDHVATLRQVRGATTSYPDIVEHAELARLGGADQITVHLREDRRHIQPKDVERLLKWGKLPINLEMAVEDEMMRYAFKKRPAWCCMVPEKRAEPTTEGGLDVYKKRKVQADFCKKYEKHGRVSMFIEPSIKQVEASAEVGAKAVEFHTGHWVLKKGRAKAADYIKLVASAERAHELGLYVHAGHGLDFDTTKEIASLPHLREVNIGHSIVCYSLSMGLKKAVRDTRRALVR